MTFLIKIGFLDFGLIDVIDISLVSVILYQAYKLMKNSAATKIVLGLLFIYLFYMLVEALEMELLSSILGQFIGVGVIVAVILFQQEIRKFLLMIGRTTEWNNEKLLSFLNIKNAINEQQELNTNVIVKALKELSDEKTGALIAISRGEELKNYIDTGDEVDALISKRLLLTIFNKYSPMHDGAVIISHGKLSAARCIIPVTENEDLPAQYGLRHRAAIGLTEVTDSVVLTVSEETGSISLAHNGELLYDKDPIEIRAKLIEYLKPKDQNEEKKSIVSKFKFSKEH